MSRAKTPSVEVAAPRLTAGLASLLGFGLLAQGATAGAFVGGHHQWLTWHENLGDALVLVPLVSLLLGLAFRRRRPEPRASLAMRAGLFVLVAAVIATGHAGGAWLALHVPAALATLGLVARQATVSMSAHRGSSGAARLAHHRLGGLPGRQR